MDGVLLESPLQSAPPALLFSSSVSGYGYEPMLKDSVDRFLAEVHKHPRDFSVFRSVFFRLLQSSPDSPLEVVWFYAAVNYFDSLPARKSALERVQAVKDLLQLLIACSASCDGRKSIALLAPVVSELYQWLVEEKELVGKAKREAEGLVEGIVSYISICSSKGRHNDGGDSVGLLACFTELVRVWGSRDLGNGDGFEVLFPLVNREVRIELQQGCRNIGYLAGMVIAEAFLLSLCFKVRGASELKAELPKELRIWAVSSVTVFQNCIFSEILLKLLLDPKLPVKYLLNSMEENFVKNILYDAILLVDYSFLKPSMDREHSVDNMKNLSLRRLLVSYEAVRTARAHGEHGKAISYINAFSTSSLPHELVSWANNHFGIGKHKGPNNTTPQALLEWLVGLEKQGWKLFEDLMPGLQTKLLMEDSTPLHNELLDDTNGNMSGADFLFEDKSAKDSTMDEGMEPMDKAFYTVACLMKSTASHVRRKRKEYTGEGLENNRNVKNKIHSSSSDDDESMTSDSEAENPLSDDEMEEADK